MRRSELTPLSARPPRIEIWPRTVSGKSRVCEESSNEESHKKLHAKRRSEVAGVCIYVEKRVIGLQANAAREWHDNSHACSDCGPRKQICGLRGGPQGGGGGPQLSSQASIRGSHAGQRRGQQDAR